MWAAFVATPTSDALVTSGTGATKAKTGGSERAQRKLEAHSQTFLSFFKLTRIRRRMFRPIEASVSCNNLSASATYKHANSTLSFTRLQLIGGGRKPRELRRSSPDTPSPVVPEDPGAEVALPEVVLLGTPVLVPRITKSRSEAPASLPS
jgi:hypothetical protein